MESFFRGTRTSLIGRGRDSIIKESLTNNLSECVKAIQFNHQTEECQHQVIGSNDLSNALCFALEAIFLHGVKDTFFKKAKSAFTTDIENKPKPSFWPLILVLSHRDNIKYISSLQQINTEIGQCRAWIRIALNDCLLSSYISTILRNINASKSFYSHSAYIRDAELLDVAQRLLEGIESSTEFELPINSSLLNSWPEDVLMLAGIWMPTMKTCPVTHTGVDVASMLTEQDTNIQQVESDLGQMLAMDQDDALKYILSSISNDAVNVAPIENATITEPVATTPSVPPDNAPNEEINDDNNAVKDSDDVDELYEERTTRPDLSTIGNSILSGKTGWSSELNDDDQDLNDDEHLMDPHSSCESGCVKTPDSKSVSPLSSSVFDTSDLRSVMRGLHKELNLTVNQPAEPEDVDENIQLFDDPILKNLGFEVITKSTSSSFKMLEYRTMLHYLGKLSLEYGLDSQDYECIQCHNMLGTIVSTAKVCTFSGKYYCLDCMDPDVYAIPARIIHNWDFQRYSVSKRAALFLTEFQHQPLLNMKLINPLIYSGVNEMATLQSLRVQLNFLRAYLFNCREPVIEELQKKVWPREYLYEHIHKYSISDLAQIPNGSLASQLQKVIAFAQTHVKSCMLCSQKGYICEICSDTKVLYPFDTTTTNRCSVCSSVFHAKCFNKSKLCPKCERIRKRQELSLVDAVHSNFTLKPRRERSQDN